MVARSGVLKRTDDSGRVLKTELTGIADGTTGCKELEKVRNQGHLAGFWPQQLGE